MIRATFPDIPSLILLLDTPDEAVGFVRAWRNRIAEFPAPTLIIESAPELPKKMPETRPSTRPTAEPVRAVNGLQPPPEHLPGGMIFDALGDEPLTTLAISQLTGVKERQTLILLERLERAGFAQRRGVVQNTLGARDATWVRAPDAAELTTISPFVYADPPPPADRKPTPGHSRRRELDNNLQAVLDALSIETLPVRQIAQRTGISANTLPKVLNHGVAKGLIQRGPPMGGRGQPLTYRRGTA